MSTAIRENGDTARVNFLQKVIAGRHHGRIEAMRPAELKLDGVPTLLQQAMFECAFTATEIYARTWAQEPSPVTDWNQHAVMMADDDHAELDTALDTTIKSMATSAAGHLDPLYLLGASSIVMRLTKLREVLRDNQRLQSPVVEWLTDLFWHTVIFDSPCYPRVDELALQVSLVGTSRSHPIRHLEPSASIERDSVREFRRAVARSVGRGFELLAPATVRAGFHGALASVLHAQFAEWDVQARQVSRPFPFPIAITTTFDLELERALALADARRAVYHVAFPVVHVTPDRHGGQLRWLVGTFRVLSETAATSAEALRRALVVPSDEGWRWLDDATKSGTLDLDGPLVLKVNGSPLHEVPARVAENPELVESVRRKLRPVFTNSEPDPGEIFHTPALAEFDLLQIAHIDEWAYGARRSDDTIEQGLPAAITRQLDNLDRFWLIVGQRLSDWSARMQLFVHVSRGLLKGSSAFAVSREFDRDRARLLDGLGISRAQGDFETLADSLNRIATEAAHRAKEGRR